MQVVKKIFNVILVIISIMGLFASCMYLYFLTIGSDKLPTAVTSTYSSYITDPMTGETHSTIEANYYSNVSKKGYEVIELRFNCYSGISKQSVYSRGFQLVFDKDGKIVPYVDSLEQTSDVWQYDSNNSGQSFMTGHDYEFGSPMFINVNGDIYAVKLDGKYTVSETKTDTKKVVRSVLCAGLNFLFEDTNMTYTEYYEVNYTFKDLLLKVRDIIRSSSTGTGNSTIALIDLGDFLHIYDVDDSGQVSAEPLGKDSFINSYFTMQTNFSNRGLTSVKQSLFSSVAGDNQFNISGVDYDVDYHQVKSVYNLTEKDFVSRYVNSENGWYYTLSSEKINELKNFNDIEINVEFNISNIKNANVLGFDYYCFYGIKLNSLSIKSDVSRNFNLLPNSLKDTGIINVSLTNVTLNNLSSGVEL